MATCYLPNSRHPSETILLDQELLIHMSAEINPEDQQDAHCVPLKVGASPLKHSPEYSTAAGVRPD